MVKPTDKKATIKTPGRPIGSNKADSLAKILPAARKRFAEQGFSKTTFKDVGKAVGMTHAALYAYYPSKAALYQATCEHAQSLLLPAYVEAIADTNTLREQLREILHVGVKAHETDSSITGLLSAIPLEIRRHPELRELMLGQQNMTVQVLADAFKKAQQRGEINSDASPEDQVITIMGAAVGIALFQYGLQRSNLRDSMEVFIALIEAGLFI